MSNFNRDWNQDSQERYQPQYGESNYEQTYGNAEWSGDTRDQASQQGSNSQYYGNVGQSNLDRGGYSQQGGRTQSPYRDAANQYPEDNNARNDREASYRHGNRNDFGSGFRGSASRTSGRYGNLSDSGYQAGVDYRGYRGNQYGNTGYSNQGVGSNSPYNSSGYGADYGFEYGYGRNQYVHTPYQGGYESGSPYGSETGRASYNGHHAHRNQDHDLQYSSFSGRFDRDQDNRWQRDNRDWFDRAGDEVMSWFGDDEAAARRRVDKMDDNQYSRNSDTRFSNRVEHRGRGPKGYRRSDSRIEEDINDRLSDDNWLDASEVDVKVSEGEVVLSGTVENRASKRRAEDLAESVSGVLNVENRIRVKREDSKLSASNSYSANTSVNTDSSFTGSKAADSDETNRSASYAAATTGNGAGKTKSGSGSI